MDTKMIEIDTAGPCFKTHNSKHGFRVFSFPSPEFWGEEIKRSSYGFICVFCSKRVELPYDEAQKKLAS